MIFNNQIIFFQKAILIKIKKLGIIINHIIFIKRNNQFDTSKWLYQKNKKHNKNNCNKKYQKSSVNQKYTLFQENENLKYLYTQ